MTYAKCPKEITMLLCPRTMGGGMVTVCWVMWRLVGVGAVREEMGRSIKRLLLLGSR